MEYNVENYTNLWGKLRRTMKKALESVVFLELNKDIYINGYLDISSEIPLPVKYEDLLDGIKNNEYIDRIGFDKLVPAMVYVIGCDDEFKFKDSYIEILKKAHGKIDDLILAMAMRSIDEGKHMDSIIYLTALDQMSDNHSNIRYNIANALKDFAAAYRDTDKKEQFDLYYNLSFQEFSKLAKEYPEAPYFHYHLGFYYLEGHEYEKALEEWDRASKLISDEDFINELGELMESARDSMTFESGKAEIIDGDVMEGLKMLIPLVEKHNGWSEAKYFTALGYRKMQNYPKAQLILNELLEAGEDFAEIFNELGLCYINGGDMEEAVQSFSRAVELKSDNVGFLCNLGLAYYHCGNVPRAKEHINKAYDLNPDDEIAVQCKAWKDSL